ncbi:hypothetical protein COU80_01220 [Candidatus Peregrinibacteria bacterium CG10_big_fil_rev_8_21_14_0_10_55_24]|nr:MAG: hypothetical protein COU80_01220 [Candidatus Peregrinibacteria bacterium CG10_big_fil_rev_8_21_14_0_10_55_24]
MRNLLLRHRPGVTFVELLLFLGVFAMCCGVLITVLVFSQEQRVRQQTITAVEQEGVQLLQMLARRVRNAENILDPPAGSSGSLIAMQMGHEDLNPTILAQGSGTVVVVEGDTLRSISPSGLQIIDLRFANTSVDAERQSARISFVAQRTIPLPGFPLYRQPFALSIALFPDNDWSGDDCACVTPQCIGGVYQWQVCILEACQDATTTLVCE